MANIKPIVNNSKINEYNDTSFLNSVLQVFSSLKYITIWMNQLNNNKQQLFSNNKYSLTKELYMICFNLYNGQNFDSSNFILNFNNKYKSIYPNKTLFNDSYHFFFYLVDLIHMENNCPNNPNFDFKTLDNHDIAELKNDNFMLNFFRTFYQQTQNSIISSNFQTIIKNVIKCELCQNLYNYVYKYIIKFNIDQYKVFRNETHPENKNQNLTIYDCFECYTGGNSQTCLNCKNQGAISYYSIFQNTKILVIALIRNTHTYKCDLDFPNILKIFDYCSNNITNNNKTQYYLKGCISMCNPDEYFADVLINNYWFRFFKNDKKMLGDVQNEIHNFEPQLLIYELLE